MFWSMTEWNWTEKSVWLRWGRRACQPRVTYPKTYPGIFKVVEVIEVARELRHGGFVNDFPTYNLLLAPHRWFDHGRCRPILRAFRYLTNATFDKSLRDDLVYVQSLLKFESPNGHRTEQVDYSIATKIIFKLTLKDQGFTAWRWQFQLHHMGQF